MRRTYALIPIERSLISTRGGWIVETEKFTLNSKLSANFGVSRDLSRISEDVRIFRKFFWRFQTLKLKSNSTNQTLTKSRLSKFLDLMRGSPTLLSRNLQTNLLQQVDQKQILERAFAPRTMTNLKNQRQVLRDLFTEVQFQRTYVSIEAPKEYTYSLSYLASP